MRTAVREIRLERGLTQEQLAELSSVPRICICRYETGKYYPSMQNAVKLAKALGVPVDALLDVQKAG